MIFRRVLLLVSLLVAAGCSSPTPQEQAEDTHTLVQTPRANGVRRPIPELIRDIGKNGLDGHGDYTPAGDELVAIGEPAIPALLEVMLAGDWNDRCCAVRVLYEITLMQYGWKAKGGWSHVPQEQRQEQEQKCRDFWDSLGPLRADDPPEKRAEAVKLWRCWLAAKQPRP